MDKFPLSISFQKIFLYFHFQVSRFPHFLFPLSIGTFFFLYFHFQVSRFPHFLFPLSIGTFNFLYFHFQVSRFPHFLFPLSIGTFNFLYFHFQVSRFPHFLFPLSIGTFNFLYFHFQVSRFSHFLFRLSISTFQVFQIFIIQISTVYFHAQVYTFEVFNFQLMFELEMFSFTHSCVSKSCMFPPFFSFKPAAMIFFGADTCKTKNQGTTWKRPKTFNTYKQLAKTYQGKLPRNIRLVLYFQFLVESHGK